MTPEQERIEELKELLDNPITGLKSSSNTNKTRTAILGLFEETIKLAKEEERRKIAARALEALPDELDHLSQETLGEIRTFIQSHSPDKE